MWFFDIIILVIECVVLSVVGLVRFGWLFLNGGVGLYLRISLIMWLVFFLVSKFVIVKLILILVVILLLVYWLWLIMICLCIGVVLNVLSVLIIV